MHAMVEEGAMVANKKQFQCTCAWRRRLQTLCYAAASSLYSRGPKVCSWPSFTVSIVETLDLLGVSGSQDLPKVVVFLVRRFTKILELAHFKYSLPVVSLD
uniref:Uncharacterized protein n=1 Tax=Pyxicephalus adspersus TaxID=30357 RepID=A0AAV2ZJ42_PYXAD|nr:TPA: hypothetical protein GDO54_016149 [Pyxicephalus adspersus]